MAPQMPWDNSCRLCAEEKIEMLPIFGEEGLRRRIAQKLRVCLPVMVYKADPLPKQICQFCAARLDDVFEFREYCLNVYKSMHLKLLTSKSLNSVKIFLDAMSNSPDPCQVQLCTIKQRAPPPLVPLLTSLPLTITKVATSIPEPEQTILHFDVLPELPCEVQIKEEPTDITADENEQQEFFDKTLELNNEKYNSERDSKTAENQTSILERVLTGNLTINDCQDLTPKTKLSSQWWCSPCNNYYRTKEGLVKHMQLYCPRKYTCGKCALVFETVEELAKHEGSDHLKITLDFDESVKECPQCDREFVSCEMLKHHRLRDHIASSIDIGTNTWCPLCNRCFTDTESYRNHKELHETGTLDNTIEHVKEDFVEVKREDVESIKSLTCPTCGKICTQQSALSNHIRTHEPKKHKCDICGRSFGLFIRLASHKLSEHNVEPLMSPVMASVEQEEALNAEREAREEREAQLRVDRHQNYSETLNGDETKNEQRPAKRAAALNTNNSKHVARCGICQECFNDHTTMLIHLQTHSNNFTAKNFACSVCKKSFKEKWQLQRHEVCHLRGNATVHDCSVCQKKFPDIAQLDAHEKIHIVDRTYHCPKCNKIFFKEFSLMTHQCTGISTFAKKSSSTKKNSRESTPIVENKKIRCPKCPATFENSKLKNLHMRKHTEQKSESQDMMDVDDDDDDDDDSMPKLIPENSSRTSTSLLEPKVKISVDLNASVPLKRTLIRTASGYRCGVCQSPFVLRELAVAHLRSAHPVMPYQCPYCKKRFTTQYTFSHHIKTDHPNESIKCA